MVIGSPVGNDCEIITERSNNTYFFKKMVGGVLCRIIKDSCEDFHFDKGLYDVIINERSLRKKKST